MGDRTLSYNQFLSFILILRAPANVNRMYTHADVAIEGGNGVKVGVVIYGGVDTNDSIRRTINISIQVRINS